MSAATKTKSTATTTSPKRKSKFIDNHKRETIFGIVLMIISLVEFIALYAAGPAGVSLYDDAAMVIVFLANLAMMAFPLFTAIKSSYHRGLRIGIIAASVVFTAPLIPVIGSLFALTMRSAGNVFGPTFNSGGVTGLYILGWVGIVVHAVAAFMLAIPRTKEDQTQLDTDKADLPGLKRNLQKAKDTLAEITPKLEAEAAVEEKARNKEDKANKAADTQGSKVKDLQKDYDRAPTTVALAEHKAELSKHKADYERAVDTRDAHQVEFDKDGQSKEKLDIIEKKLITAKAEVERLKKKVEQLEKELPALEDAVAKSQVQLDLDAGQAELKKLSKERDDLIGPAEDAKKQLDKLANRHKSASKVLKANQKKVDETEARINELSASEKSVFRDVAFWSIVPLALSLLGFLPNWYVAQFVMAFN